MNITKTRYSIDGTDKFIEIEFVPVDFLVNIPIMDDTNRLIGRAILTKNCYMNQSNGKPDVKETVVLTDIIIYDPEDRGKGAGDSLMGFITSCGYFTTIITGISTEAGRTLCLKWGFKQETIKGNKLLVWRKEGQDAT